MTKTGYLVHYWIPKWLASNLQILDLLLLRSRLILVVLTHGRSPLLFRLNQIFHRLWAKGERNTLKHHVSRRRFWKFGLVFGCKDSRVYPSKVWTHAERALITGAKLVGSFCLIFFKQFWYASRTPWIVWHWGLPKSQFWNIQKYYLMMVMSYAY